MPELCGTAGLGAECTSTDGIGKINRLDSATSEEMESLASVGVVAVLDCAGDGTSASAAAVANGAVGRMALPVLARARSTSTVKTMRTR